MQQQAQESSPFRVPAGVQVRKEAAASRQRAQYRPHTGSATRGSCRSFLLRRSPGLPRRVRARQAPCHRRRLLACKKRSHQPRTQSTSAPGGSPRADASSQPAESGLHVFDNTGSRRAFHSGLAVFTRLAAARPPRSLLPHTQPYTPRIHHKHTVHDEPRTLAQSQQKKRPRTAANCLPVAPSCDDGDDGDVDLA